MRNLESASAALALTAALAAGAQGCKEYETNNYNYYGPDQPDTGHMYDAGSDIYTPDTSGGYHDAGRPPHRADAGVDAGRDTSPDVDTVPNQCVVDLNRYTQNRIEAATATVDTARQNGVQNMEWDQNWDDLGLDINTCNYSGTTFAFSYTRNYGVMAIDCERRDAQSTYYATYEHYRDVNGNIIATQHTGLGVITFGPSTGDLYIREDAGLLDGRDMWQVAIDNNYPSRDTSVITHCEVSDDQSGTYGPVCGDACEDATARVLMAIDY